MNNGISGHPALAMRRVLAAALTTMALASTASCAIPETDSKGTSVSDFQGGIAEEDTATGGTAEKPKETKPAAPAYTMAQRNAISSAENYLDYDSFSKKGLIRQLKYEGFSTKDATFAVEHIKVDWRKQAAHAAKNYLEYDSFSRDGLLRQLTYEGYTTAEAKYGAKAVGY